MYRLSSITSVSLNKFITNLIEEYTFSRAYFKSILKVVKGSFRDVADLLTHKNVETTENYYITTTDEIIKYGIKINLM